MSQTIEIELSEDVFLAVQKDPKDLARRCTLPQRSSGTNLAC